MTGGLRFVRLTLGGAPPVFVCTGSEVEVTVKLQFSTCDVLSNAYEVTNNVNKTSNNFLW